MYACVYALKLSGMYACVYVKTILYACVGSFFFIISPGQRPIDPTLYDCQAQKGL